MANTKIEVEETNLEDLILLGEDKLINIIIEYPTENGTTTAKAKIKQLTKNLQAELHRISSRQAQEPQQAAQEQALQAQEPRQAAQERVLQAQEQRQAAQDRQQAQEQRQARSPQAQEQRQAQSLQAQSLQARSPQATSHLSSLLAKRNSEKTVFSL